MIFQIPNSCFSDWRNDLPLVLITHIHKTQTLSHPRTPKHTTHDSVLQYRCIYRARVWCVCNFADWLSNVTVSALLYFPIPQLKPISVCELEFFLPLRGNCLAFSRQCVTTCTLMPKCSKHSTLLSWDLRLWLKWDMFRLLFWYWEATMFGLVEGLLGGGGKSCSVCAGICACVA